MSRTSGVYDVVGVGFGPSNIAAAIALSENETTLDAIFLEQKNEFAWHPGMLFNGATIQVSFLKDLVTFRNPTSPFSFVNYLYENGRLADFSNLKTFFPTRLEFHDYFGWCGDAFRESVYYGRRVEKIEPIFDSTGTANLFRVHATTDSGPETYLARSIIHAGGLRPTLPAGIVETDRVFHGYGLLHQLGETSSLPANSRFIVVGAGQSAAEIVEFISDRYPDATVDAVFSRFGYMPADDSPLVNEIFNPEAVDQFFAADQEGRDKVLEMHATTNYAAVDLDLIESLYNTWYQDRVRQQERIRFHRLLRITGAEETSSGVSVTGRSVLDNSITTLEGDYVICASGFQPRSPLELLSPSSAEAVLTSVAGTPQYTRKYQLQFDSRVQALLYSVGVCEPTHGLTATLLSNMAVRAGEIVTDIAQRLGTSRLGVVHEDG